MAAGSPGPLVVDISGLDFMGCCAYAALGEEAERCRRRGVEMRLVSSQPIVARIVTACGLSELLPVDDSVDIALSACAPAD
jgi:anti-anti-sigma factor